MYEIDDLPNKPGHLIRLAHQKAISVFSDATQGFNITAVQHVIMVALNRFPDIDLSNLAQIVGLDRSTTGNVAARLSDRGLVTIKRRRRTGARRSYASPALESIFRQPCCKA